MAKSGKEQQIVDLYNLVAKANDRLKKVHTKHLGGEKLTSPTIWCSGCLNETWFHSIKKD